MLERLRADGLLTQSQMQQAMIEARRMNERAEETLLRTGVLTEAELLGHLAKAYGTRFVSTEKLARADVTKSVLHMVPRRLCTRLGCFPILFQAKKQTLMVVAGDLESHDVEKQIRLVTTVARLQVLVARPAAVDAAIAKHYDSKPRAFASLVAPRKDAGGFGASGFDGGGFGGGGFVDVGDFGGGDFGGGGFGGGGFEPFGSGAPDTAPRRASTPRKPAASDFTIEAPEIVAGLQTLASVPSVVPPPPPPERVSVPEPVAQEPERLLDFVHVFMALLDSSRGDLRDHGATVARVARSMCDRLGVTGSRADGIVLAGYLHDVGKTSNYHLTALNVAKYEGHAMQAQSTHLAPVRLFQSAGLPAVAARALTHLYERYDGKGFPERLSGSDIPLGARIISLAETYADLTGHAKNPYRKQLTPAEACEAIESLAPEVFDPSLLELLRQVTLGGASDATRATVLLVDPDPDGTMVLDIRLSAAGYDVRIARDAADALKRIEQTDVQAVITEVELPGDDGFTLVNAIRRAGKNIPFVFLTSRGDRENVQRGFELGAADYLVKPASPEVVVEKARQVLQSTGGRGVAGSLSEMSLPDVIQIMGNGRKTGRLVVRSMGRTGEINFGDGLVWDARFDGERGEEAFYRLLLLTTGDFSLDTSHSPTVRLIQTPTETLLLEGMRRLDESNL